MDKNDLYRDIARRTNGEIYIGVVGAGTYRQVNLHQALYGRYGDTQHTGRKRQGAANRRAASECRRKDHNDHTAPLHTQRGGDT